MCIGKCTLRYANAPESALHRECDAQTGSEESDSSTGELADGARRSTGNDRGS